MKFEVGKKYRSRCGEVYTVLSTAAKGYYSVVCQCDDDSYIYSVTRNGISPRNASHDLIEEVREPLRAEFECEWVEPHLSIIPCGPDTRLILKPFIGKRTKVTIEEII